jgi:carboxyl-terminal processing protease
MKKLIVSVFFFLFSYLTYSQTTIQESERIATFCKVWGFLKYYHPTVAKGKLDWDNEFMSRIKVVNALNTKEEINTYYSEWISSLGKIKTCKKCNQEIADSLKFNLDLAFLSDSTIFTKNLIDQLHFIQQNRNQGKNYYVQQVKYVGNTNYENEKPYIDSIFPSIELRLLGLARYWNIINYFYPYKYIIGEDWNKALVEMIPKFKDAKDTIAYHMAMRELTAKLNDSHAGLSTKYTDQYFGLKCAPFRFNIIDNKAVVTSLFNDSLCKINDIQIGDVFMKVGNKSIKDIIAEKSKYIGASNEATKLRNFTFAIFNGATDSVRVSYERNGNIAEKTLYRYYFKEYKYKWADDVIKDTCKILDGNIGYLNLGLLQPKQTELYLNKLKDTKAIIFDVRNYPNGTVYRIAKFLNADYKPFAKFTKADLSYPGVFHFTSPIFCGKKNDSPYTGKVILLFNELSQSHAEFTLMALQTAANVTSIGSQTAGADGNVS